jgi:hypothetical protein
VITQRGVAQRRGLGQSMNDKFVNAIREVLESGSSSSVAGSAFTTVNTHVELPAAPAGRIRVGPEGSDVFFVRDNRWRGTATEYVLEEGAEIFRAAGKNDDGSIQLREDRSNPRPYSHTGRVGPDGSWSTETVRPLRKVTVHTTARGVLGKSARPIELHRVARGRDGSTAWTVDATTSYVNDPDHPDQTVRKTSGTIAYADGATGTFETLMSFHGDYRSVSRIPGREDSGVKHFTLPDGTKVTERFNPIPGGGGFMRQRDTVKVTEHADDGGKTTVTTKTETVISGSTSTTVSTESTETSRRFDMDGNATNPKGDSMEFNTHTEFKDSQGRVTKVDESVVFGPDHNRTTVTHTEHPDGSTELDVLNWPLSGESSRRVQTFDKDGNPQKDETTEVQMDQSGSYVPVPGSSSGSTSSDGQTGGNSEKGDSGSSDSSGGSGDGDSPKVVDDEDDGLGVDGDETESSDDPDGYNDDTAPSGMTWDGQDCSLLTFLRDHGSSLFGGEDPYRQCDELGLEALTPLLAEALRANVDRPSSGGGGEGLGDDTPGSESGVTLQLGTDAHSVADPWGDWGDFSNPKAHRQLLLKVRDHELKSATTDAGVRTARLTTLDFASHQLDLMSFT